eukprot:196093-Heterocapsa_arctica.AAC.1
MPVSCPGPCPGSRLFGSRTQAQAQAQGLAPGRARPSPTAPGPLRYAACRGQASFCCRCEEGHSREEGRRCEKGLDWHH